MIVPKRNEKDLPDIPEEVRKTLKFTFVDNIDEVLAAAIGPTGRPLKRNRNRVNRFQGAVLEGFFHEHHEHGIHSTVINKVTVIEFRVPSLMDPIMLEGMG